MRDKLKTIFFVSLLFQASCGFLPEKTTMDDPRIQALLKVAESFDRSSYGFTPIPKSADVRLEISNSHAYSSVLHLSTTAYDVMLHISSNTSRTIAFKKAGNGYKWIGEQEIFQGPKKVSNVDGTYQENISLTYELEKISGYPINKLNILYIGEDKRLTYQNELTLKQIRPILKEWGY